ncbi:MAG: hypothetical protein M1818_003907 [Claussenomyces sp. TS43310]|nr:MAG: hypothetical protein M1818_003907 [Claussenomyces sp. TS43310]
MLPLLLAEGRKHVNDAEAESSDAIMKNPRAVIARRLVLHPVGYVRSLEQHAASLERTLNATFPGAAPDHLHDVQAQFPGMEQIGVSPDDAIQYQWQNPQSSASPDANSFENVMGGYQEADVLVGLMGGLQSSPRGTNVNDASPTLEVSDTAMPASILSTQPDQIPTATAASFFRTYFWYIHPQYPFLNLKDCGDWYLEWKTAPPAAPIRGWPAFFVKMIFAIGSLIQSKSDDAPRYQHQSLKAQAQAEQAIIADSKSTSLIRIQAMLLSAMHALHCDSMSRITHISGAIMRFASLQGFHLLEDTAGEENQMKIKAWSCAYILINTEGYQSPLWLQLISQISRLLICRPTKSNINTSISDVALQASCDCCTIFRALQKRRQVAQPWLVVLTQFQAGVTLFYIVWGRRSSPMSTEADNASRDCTAVLAIFADRWRNAELYRDCLELLARAVPRVTASGLLDASARAELAHLTRSIEEAGIHRHVARMLWEMCAEDDNDMPD